MGDKILVVDDSKVSRMFICNFFKQLQPEWQILEAGDSQEALQLAQQHQFRLITLDYNMPDTNGLELANQLKALGVGCFMGLLTANVQRSTQEQADAAGVFFYKKPVNPELIGQIVQDAEKFYGAV